MVARELPGRESRVEKGAGCTEGGCCVQPLIWVMTCHLAHPYGSHGVGTSRAFSEVSAHTLPCCHWLHLSSPERGEWVDSYWLRAAV